MKDYVVLVDEDDNEIGLCEKLEAHEKGLLHRAFSVVLFSRQNPGKILLQQRAGTKYHCPLLWANTCCSHPRQNEKLEDAVRRRLREELGMDAAGIAFDYLGPFTYRTPVGELVEHEVDHVFTGVIDEAVPPFNPAEVEAVAWVDIKSLADEGFSDSIRKYVPWLDKVVYKVLAHNENIKSKVAV